MRSAITCLAIAGTVHADEGGGQLSEILGGDGANRCGPQSLQICAGFLNQSITQNELLKHLPNDGHLTSFVQLRAASQQLGFSAIPVKWEGNPRGIGDGTAAVLAVEKNGEPHFIAALGVRGNEILIADFPFMGWTTAEELQTQYRWKGESLHLAKGLFCVLCLYLELYIYEVFALLAVAVTSGFLFDRQRRRSSGTLRAATSPLACCVAIGLLTCLAIGCGETEVRPVVYIDPAALTVTADNESSGESATEFAINFVNASDSEVRVARVQASCGCTTVGKIESKSVPPGGRSKIAMRADVPEFGSKSVSVAVTVELDDREMTLISKVLLEGLPWKVPSLIAAPEGITLDWIDGQWQAKVINIDTREALGSPQWITALSAKNSKFTTEQAGFSERETDDASVVFRRYSYEIGYAGSGAATNPQRPSEKAESVLEVVTSTESIPRIHVQAKQPAVMRIVPTQLFVDRKHSTDVAFERAIKIVVPNEEKLRNTSITVICDTSWIDIVSVKVNPANASEAVATLRFHADRVPSDRGHLDKLVITLAQDATTTAKVEVPIVIAN